MPATTEQTAEPTQATGQTPQTEWVPNPDDPVTHIQVGDNHFHIHTDDLAEAQKRNPNLIVHGPANAETPASPALQTDADPSEQILRSAQGLDDNTRVDAWDIYHQSKDEDDLASRLQSINLPDSVKADLWDAKHQALTTKPLPPLSQSRSQRKGKALVPAMGGGMMFMDVPEGHEASTEQASDKGQAMGTGAGAGMVASAAGLGAALAPTVTEEAVGTGIMDEFGKEITRQVTKIGASRAAQLASRIAQYAMKPGLVARFPGGALTEKLIFGDMMSKGKMHETLLHLFGLGE